MKKTTFCVRIFDISPYVFTQILSGRARWMRNLILHPTSTHTAYFWRTPLPQKQEIPEKTWWRIQRVPTLHTFDGPRCPKNKKYLKKCNDDIIITFFQVFLVFGAARSVKSMPSGYSLDAEFNSASNDLPIEIWVKTRGDMPKIQTKK